MKKIVAILLCLILVIPTAAGCARNPETGTRDDTTTSAILDTSSPDDTTTETGLVEDDLGDDIDFNGEPVRILYWSDVQNTEFEVKELTGDIIQDAIFDRNRAIEERLGVSLEWTGVPGNYDNQTGFVSEAQNDVLAGGTSYDIFAGYSMTAATLALRGCTQNLLALDFLNFEKPWWPDSLIEQSTISEKLFFCSGDISCNLLYMMYSVYFNQDLITKYSLENPYELVYDNRWTVDKLIEMSKGLYEDLNANNASDQSDLFGLVTMNVFYDAFFWGSGLTEIEKDANGKLVISESWDSEKTLRLLEKLCPFFHESGDTFTTNGAGIHAVFGAGNSLFALTEAQYSLKGFKASGVNYGVVPVPKYDSNQKNYVTILSFPYTMYSISSVTKKANIASAVLECYASESYRRVTPAVFETSFKYKYSSGSDDVVMWDIIRESVSFELGRIFTTSLNNLSYSLFRNAVVNNSAASWPSQFKANRKVIEKLIDAIQDTISSLE
ncbi:MAG: hypothetical protein GX057_06175 [Clostridiales bacterium]|jgi:hypothetical protein|nr:hypothetical protein [Clostridiales bacterium]